MSCTVLQFPRRRPPDVSYLPRGTQRELARIEQWLVVTQSSLAELPAATLDYQHALRLIADGMRAETLAKL